MEANELRIGNFLYFPFTQEIVEVLGINAYETNKGIKNTISFKRGLSLYCEEISSHIIINVGIVANSSIRQIGRTDFFDVFFINLICNVKIIIVIIIIIIIIIIIVILSFVKVISF